MFLLLLPRASCKKCRVHPEGHTCVPSLRAAILEKMPLVDRGGPQADEEVKESKEATHLLEPAPVPTEPQVRRRKPRGEEDLVGLPCLALILLPFPHRPQSSWIC